MTSDGRATNNKIADTFNEHGTPVTMFRCKACDGIFTVCPAVADDSLDQWTECLAETCQSYDPARDADRMFDEGLVQRVGDRSHLFLVARRAENGAADGGEAVHSSLPPAAIPSSSPLPDLLREVVWAAKAVSEDASPNSDRAIQATGQAVVDGDLLLNLRSALSHVMGGPAWGGE